MRRLLPLLAALALVACGCGSSSSPGDALSGTAANLSKITSGDLSLDLRLGEKGGARSGFTLEGPFALRGGQLQAAQMDYTQLAGSQTLTSTFIWADGKAYVRTAGTTYELPEKTAREISSTLAASGGLSGQLDLSGWIVDPKISDGGEVGGAATDKISARLDVVQTLNTILGLATSLGGSASTPLAGKSAEQIRNAVDTASIDVWTGKDDRLLRKLAISLDLAPKAGQDIRKLVGASLELTLGISNPNEPVRVEAPTDAQPYSGSL